MTRTVLTLVVTFVAMTAATFAVADVLLIEEVRQAENMSVPENGTSMAEVESRFGAPASKDGPVGDPPITQWVYDTWSVYFEYDKVLFTVLHKGAVIEPSANAQKS
ncbi:MAG TPA: hypothetical protein VJN01_04870 [Xanthomonadales bacterium]|nr:hypothetical protein [Xanthomonadales bacterium]